jgi:hypothetical protein
MDKILLWFKKLCGYTEKVYQPTEQVVAFDKEMLYLPMEAWYEWPQWVDWDKGPRTDLRCTGNIVFCEPDVAERENGGYDLNLEQLREINPKDIVAYRPIETLYHLD